MTIRINPSDTLTGAAAGATFVSLWKPATTYTAGQFVLNPSGQLVSALATFTSGSTYTPNNWSTPSGSLVVAESVAEADALNVPQVLLVGGKYLGAPTSLSATRGDSKNTLFWTASADAEITTQRVYRKVGAGAEVLYQTLSPGVATLVDTALTNGTAYTYRITSYDTVTSRESTSTATVSSTPVAVVSPLTMTPTDAWWTEGTLYAASGRTDSTALASWPNEVTGRPALAQATGTSQPLHRSAVTALAGKPAVQFDGVDDVMSAASPGTLAQPFTVVIIAAVDNATTDGCLLATGSLSNQRGISTTGGNWSNAWGTLATGTPATTGVHLLIGSGNGTSSTLEVDGNVVVASDAGVTGLGGRLVGGQTAGTRNKACRIVGIFTFPRLLTTQEKTDLRNYAQSCGAA